ncbi:mechanosensitive ion channel family protein [Corynebacterium gerontici]|uniref:Small-conductance mechanosensitive channel n=1 Tax=Corynebacterium gerontici TaxID=2079234 RepID=A0A3G6J350_9CORY|nr:mechanosensitive ion channel domain-containing protein [Corynebacterium gerontici]AZA12133.1 Small-conductance mechanosensitive channel [Corynebacterium gerontici]
MSLILAADNPTDQVQQAVQSLTWHDLGIGVVIIAVGAVIGWIVKFILNKALVKIAHRTKASARAFSSIAQWVVIALAIAAAITYVFPSVKPVNLIGGLGVVSIAAGIAFQTVLGNTFAGLVILMRETPLVGDQIQIGDVAGTITDINLSTTTVRTFSGRQVLIPNGTVHTSIVTVQTRHEWVRTNFDVKIRHAEDFEKAREVAVKALDRVEGILESPAPVAVLRQVADGMATMEVRFWSGSKQMDTVAALDAAIVAVTTDLSKAGIEFGPDNTVMFAGGE